MKKLFLLSMSLVLTAVSLRAQFAVEGTERTFVRWNTFSTDSYQFIFPAGCDSLAREYAFQWEKYKLSVGYDRVTRKPLPVVLHPYTSTSNGFVAWTPSRMEMFLAPDMYSPEPLPWHTLLAIHENRHVAQKGFLYKMPFKIFNIFGELLSNPLCLVYSTSMYMEGDAVATETALSQAGRGRSADFLEYIRTSFEEGDTRNIYRWRYGSQKLYTPDYYKIGYLAAGGMGIGPHDEFFCNTLGEQFDAFSVKLQREWEEDTRSRAPFQNFTQLTENESYYLSYSGLTSLEGKVYAVQAGLAENPALVSFDPQDGFKKKVLRHIGADSPLEGSDGKIYWTEEIPDLRWEMHSTSALRSFDGRRIRTEVGGRRLYNPSVENGKVAVVENLPMGEVVVRVYEALPKMQEKESFYAPSGLQVLEAVWVDGHLYASALSPQGQGIYDVENGFRSLVEASFVKINHLFQDNGHLCFTSDRTGVNELYSLNVDTGDIFQLTNLPRGGKDFTFVGDSLYFTVLSTGGRNICVCTREDLPEKVVNFNQRHAYALADSLSAIKRPAPLDDKLVNIGETKKYGKLGHALRIHSWSPLYSETDDLSTLTYEEVTSEGGIGPMLYFQNNLSMFYGSAGTGIMLKQNQFVGRVSANMTYRGLYPIFQVKALASKSLSVYGNNAYGDTYDVVLRSYIPFNLSRNAWSSAIIPVVTYEQVPSVGRLAGGIRAYSILPTRTSAIFPRLGIGTNIEVSNYQTINSVVNANLYPSVSLYGYLPGFFKTHSFALNAKYTNAFVNVSETDYRSETWTASVRYGIPFLSIDCAKFSPLVYVRNFELIPFYEYNRVKVLDAKSWHVAGSYFNAIIGNIWFIPVTMRVGVKTGYNTDTKKVECNFVLSYDL